VKANSLISLIISFFSLFLTLSKQTGESKKKSSTQRTVKAIKNREKEKEWKRMCLSVNQLSSTCD
jgi:predicted phosphoadenosine phosphosulfate sulfurtransferase